MNKQVMKIIGGSVLAIGRSAAFQRFVLVIMLVFGAAALSTPAYALSCGDVVTANTTLTADLSCDGNGLIVGASGVTIDLNGFSISCHDVKGYLGSCQNSSTTLPLLTYVGIQSTGHNAVTVLGPGTITGFSVGVRMASGTGLNVIGTTITGPAPSVDFPVTERLLTVGVLVANTNCTVSSFAAGWTAVVELNDISQETQGVQLEEAGCTLIEANNIHDNRGAFGDTHGVDLISSSFNTVYVNLVTRNGRNVSFDSGIVAFDAVNGPTSIGNQILSNYVIDNCADGITLANGAAFNNVAGNTALNNGNSVQNGLCVLPPPSAPFFDLADRNEGAGDFWNTNNTCKTQSPGVPPGVCP